MDDMRPAIHTVALLVVLTVLAFSAPGADKTMHFRFDGDLKGESGTAAAKADSVRFGDGHEDHAVMIDRPAVLAYPTDGLNTDAFTISFWVRHEKRLEDYFYRRLVYFWHETADMKNRIGILKRAGTNYFVFFFSDNQGRAKGANFGGDWAVSALRLRSAVLTRGRCQPPSAKMPVAYQTPLLPRLMSKANILWRERTAPQ